MFDVEKNEKPSWVKEVYKVCFWNIGYFTIW